MGGSSIEHRAPSIEYRAGWVGGLLEYRRDDDDRDHDHERSTEDRHGDLAGGVLRVLLHPGGPRLSGRLLLFLLLARFFRHPRGILPHTAESTPFRDVSIDGGVM